MQWIQDPSQSNVDIMNNVRREVRRMRKVTWWQTPTVLWLGGGNISPSYSMCMGLMMLGRQKYTQQDH